MARPLEREIRSGAMAGMQEGGLAASRHRVPPHNLEAEKSVLGGILLEKDAINKVFEHLSPDGSDFYSEANAKLFRVMVSLFDANTPIDEITLMDHFRESGGLDSVGGLAYVSELLESTPTAANISYYAKIVKEKGLLRKLITTATDIVARGYEGSESVEEFIDEAERSIYEVSEKRSSKSVFALKDLIKDSFETIEKLYEKKTHLTGVPSCYDDLDKLTSGFQNSDLVIIAGRPSMGKTTFALNIAENAAIIENRPVAVFSLEMSKEQLVQRMLASRSKVGLQAIRSGFLKESDWGALTTAVGTLYDAPIYIDDTPAMSVLEMRAKARRWKTEYDIEMVVVDYLQLMRGRSTTSREQEISEISRSLKAMAKELQIPVIALSQLARRAEDRTKSRPMLSDLRESGAIEQDADVVMFVYRESVYDPCDCPPELCSCGKRRDAEIIVEKQRNGPTGNIHLTFFREYTRFENQIQMDNAEIHGEWAE